MKLYAIVGIYTEYDGDEKITEWTYVVRDKMPEYDDSKQVLASHIAEVSDVEPDDFDIVDCWTNNIDEIDGYKITVTKEHL